MSTAHFQGPLAFGVFWTNGNVIQTSKSWVEQTCTVNNNFTILTTVVWYTSEMKSIGIKNVAVVILSENNCYFVSFLACKNNWFFFLA
jgi:hypothetical protein